MPGNGLLEMLGLPGSIKSELLQLESIILRNLEMRHKSSCRLIYVLFAFSCIQISFSLYRLCVLYKLSASIYRVLL
ncbi:hypothetical protein M431DRAFT_304091 [Trichoderma harzianum CBS 226.95]|uniref:Uncharacterized protein n=1 Tax=Trichoderma harzianum CBS 226.95 TaxID=983964 RepID=A0A2T4AQV6_TRIHA|nr:hypothetical protein M431DRAFT_304091 [Trichoderma harzianum CBS 226.95]PTB59454.1 hypothetical protein M431DRAFT_304091 [Trichoderma harzianum CBS 226.95]